MTKNKIALITGGSRGLGRDMALSLARQGTDIILTYRTKQSEAYTTIMNIEAMGRKAVSLQLDMADFGSLDQFVENLTKTLADQWSTDSFDFLINNAGMGATVPFLEVKEALFDEFLNVHLKGCFF